MEHGSVLPPDSIHLLADMGITVVTQPSFLRVRGDQYLRNVESDDLPHLYRCASLDQAGVGVAGSTDAPFGPEDPWAAMATAVDRRSQSEVIIGVGERLSPTRAAELFFSAPESPGGPPRMIQAGEPADLCLLDCTQRRAIEDLDTGHVMATLVAGQVVFQR
jgi:predicted amidohydrolase YtcJ